MAGEGEDDRMDADRIGRLRTHMVGRGLARRIGRYLNVRGEDARRTAIGDVVTWMRLLGQIGYPGDPLPSVSVLGRIERTTTIEADEDEGADLVGAADLCLDEVINARRSRSPEHLVSSFLFGSSGLPIGMTRAPGMDFMLPDPLAARIASIDAGLSGLTSIEVSWALRVGLVLNADQALEAALSRLEDNAPDNGDPETALRYIHADVLTISSALLAAALWRPAVPTVLVHLMIVHIIDTWMHHETHVFAEGDEFELAVEQAERAMEEREATLRWLDRLEEWVTRTPGLSSPG